MRLRDIQRRGFLASLAMAVLLGAPVSAQEVYEGQDVVGKVREHFNANRGKLRFVALLSPS